MSNEVPRRFKIDQMTPAEKAITGAMTEVEKMPCGLKLTEAIDLLYKAREIVADYVDNEIVNKKHL